MPKGGSRVRSGPPADPTSARSEKRGVVLTALPSKGRPGRAPAFPLPKINRMVVREGARVPDKPASTAFRARELAIWREVWKTPQAVAWDLDPWRWPTIAEFCRLKAVTEADPDASASLLSRLREYRNEIGLSPDGLRANGWAIARDEVAAATQRRAPAAPAATKAPPVRRLRGVPDAG